MEIRSRSPKLVSRHLGSNPVPDPGAAKSPCARISAQASGIFTIA